MFDGPGAVIWWPVGGASESLPPALGSSCSNSLPRSRQNLPDGQFRFLTALICFILNLSMRSYRLICSPAIRSTIESVRRGLSCRTCVLKPSFVGMIESDRTSRCIVTASWTSSLSSSPAEPGWGGCLVASVSFCCCTGMTPPRFKRLLGALFGMMLSKKLGRRLRF